VPDKFLPSRHGFTFDNVWPAQPAVVVPTPFGDVPFGKANGGLCGGMVFAALDYWNAGRQPPASRPPLGTPLYSFIVRRLLESWRLPGGVAKYYEWMGMPDTDAPAFQLFGRPLLTRRGIAYRTISGEWPGIRTELDRGSPVPLGVITVSSRQAKDLALNHQVLAYAYTTNGNASTVRVYDPNRGRRDDIAITFQAGASPATFTHNLGIGGRPVRGFFRTGYRAQRLPSGG
jgi:hypothetical protein